MGVRISLLDEPHGGLEKAGIGLLNAPEVGLMQIGQAAGRMDRETWEALGGKQVHISSRSA